MIDLDNHKRKIEEYIKEEYLPIDRLQEYNTSEGDKRRLQAIVSILRERSLKDNDIKLIIGSIFDNARRVLDGEFSIEVVDEVLKDMESIIQSISTEKEVHGEVLTPIDLVNDILDNLPKEVWSDPNKKWLDPANGTGSFTMVVYYRLIKGLEEVIPDINQRRKHILENMLYVGELQFETSMVFLSLVDFYDDININIFSGDTLSDEFDYHMKNVWRVDRFDIVVGNPPYQRNLHIKFLEKCHDISDIVLFIHPSPWIFRRDSLLSKEKNRVKSIELVNGNSKFIKAEFGAPLSITYIDKSIDNKLCLRYNNSGNSYDIVHDDIPSGFYEPSIGVNNIISKYNKLTKITNLLSILEKNETQEFMITAPRICGHAVNRSEPHNFFTRDFYTLFYPKSNLNDRNTKNKVFVVDSEEERERLIKYMKSKVCRFGLMINKLSQDSHISKYLVNIPLPDLSIDIDDYYKYFGFNEEERDIIEREIPDYY